jgi:hypothetical protein
LFSVTMERPVAISDWSVALAPRSNTGWMQIARGALTAAARL